MRWYEFVHESDDVVDQTHDALMDMLTPLQSQGITSITVEQAIDQISLDPNLQGIQITDDLIMQALQRASGVKVAPDPANGGAMTIQLNPDAPSTRAAQHQTEKGEEKVNQAALRQSTKDLNP